MDQESTMCFRAGKGAHAERSSKLWRESLPEKGAQKVRSGCNLGPLLMERPSVSPDKLLDGQVRAS
jgi:hypothetical protein